MPYVALNDFTSTTGGVTSTVGGQTVTGVFNQFTNAITSESSALKVAITSAADNPNDPTNLIKMQAAMANYNMALMVTSSVVKSVEETAKSITQKL